MLPEEVLNEREESAVAWLMQNRNLAVREWFEGVRKDFRSNPYVLVDDPRNWDYAISLLRQLQWPAPTSPSTSEQFLMNFAWWFACMEAKGRGLAVHYAGLLGRLTTPGTADAAGHGVLHERERVKILRSLGSIPRFLDATFDMDSKVRAWAKAWARSGFCKVEIAPKTVAALINSDAPPDVKAPWEAFSVILPPGLCDPVRRLWCCALPETQHVALLSAVQEDGRAFASDPTNSGAAPWATSNRHTMLENLARGACIAIENGSAERRESNSTKATKKGEKLPVPIRWCISAPIQIDFREHVVREWRGQKKSPQFKAQWCVRGHYRNQPCGPQLSERRRIWVHPYWKGDPGGISLLRRVEVNEVKP